MQVNINLAKKLLLFMTTLAGNAYAETVISHHQGLQLTSEQIKTEYLAQPEDIQKKLKDNEELFRKFVDAIHNEKLFEVQAEKQHLRDDAMVAAKIDIAVRKVLIEEMLRQKKQSIRMPDMAPLALAEYDAHPEKYLSDEQVHARHILVEFDAQNKAEKLTFMQGIKARVLKGEDFAELAKQYSEDKGSAPKGGDLGVFKKSEMVPAFAEAAFALQKSKQLSDIVETKFGWHLIQLIEQVPAKTKPFAEVKAELVANLEQEYLKNEFNTWRNTIIDTKEATLNEVALGNLIGEIKKLP